MGGVGNGAAEEDWCWDLNLGLAALQSFGGPWGFGESWDLAALGCSLLPHGLGSRRDLAGKKRGERTLAGGPSESSTWSRINWRSQQQHS